MEPKDKAKELVDKFADYVSFNFAGDEEPIFEHQKQCALICVDEIISAQFYLIKWFELDESFKATPNFWYQVKDEINKL